MGGPGSGGWRPGAGRPRKTATVPPNRLLARVRRQRATVAGIERAVASLAAAGVTLCDQVEPVLEASGPTEASGVAAAVRAVRAAELALQARLRG